MPPPTPTRRTVLFLTTGVVAFGSAACARDQGPDELEAPWAAARTDAAAAALAARSFPDAAPRLTPVADARRAHADALAAEIRRARPDRSAVLDTPAPTPVPPTSAAAAAAALRDTLTTARDAGSALAVSTARYRSGLVAAVAASCAGFVEVLGT